MTTELTPKEAQFIDEWLIDKNASRAALAVGYSKATAAKTGYQILQKPHIQRAVKRALDEQQRRTLITADAVLRNIQRISEKAEAAGRYDAAIRGQELLGKHYKLFTEKHEHGGIGGGAVILQVSGLDEAL
jgi:phage terminase small subunit